MSIKKKIDELVQEVSDRITNTSDVSQEENMAEGEKKPFGRMPELIRKAGAESIVLLKNEKNNLPYNDNTVVSVFGRCQIDYFYVGYGSGGDVNPPYTVNLIEGLQNAGVKLNPFLLGFYKTWCEANPVSHGVWGQWPMCYEEAVLDEELVEQSAKESNTALVVIGRAAGEDRENKLEKGSYYLNDREIQLLDMVTKHFDSVTVLMNCGNIVDMSWINSYGDKISSVLYVWQGGMESGNSVADVLTGKVNPCGKLVDTIAIHYDDYPTSGNFGNKDFNNYEEDIYVGYRYFESFCPDRALFPFGFGLSYTSFDISVRSFEHKDGRISVTAVVENTGEVAGKESVQLYVSAPQGSLSKAKYSLVAFGKTDIIEPHQSCEIVLTADDYAFASFDDTGDAGAKFAYVLEQGEYTFHIGSTIRDLTEAGSFTLEETIVLEQLQSICPVFSELDRIKAVEVDGKLIPKRVKLALDPPHLRERIKKAIPAEIGYDPSKNYNLQQVADGEITLDEFISCLSNEELEGLTRGEGTMDSKQGVVGNAGCMGGTLPCLREKGVRPVITTDGPAGIRVRKYTSLLPCGTALASSWDTALVQELMTEMGREMVFIETDVILAPGMNIHRDPLCGRNFEYFSEDPLVSGKMAAAYVNGIQSNGVSACPKHFACNNQEWMRTKNDTCISQRALREIYLKGFEICIKESKPLNIMTSYNKINGVWSHYNFDTCTTVLRGEWGYEGTVMTDWWMQKSRSPEFPNIRDNAYRVRAQVDVYMPGGTRLDKKYKSDGTLLETVGTIGGLTRAEIERTARTVLKLVLKLKY